jgi:hypothetical protein
MDGSKNSIFAASILINIIDIFTVQKSDIAHFG